MAMVKVNLLPPRVRQARARRLMIAVGAVVGLAVLTVPLGLLYVKWSAVASLKREIRRVDEESKAFAGIIERIVAIDNQEAALVKNLDVLDKLTSRQAVWIRFLEALEVSQRTAHDLWLTQVISKRLTGADADKIEVTLIGTVFSAASFDVFLRSLLAGDLPIEMSQKTPPSASGTKVGNDPALTFTAVVRVKA